MFQPKGHTTLETVVVVSRVGPIGLPRVEAMYPAISTPDGTMPNAQHDNVIKMSRDELPPATAFWSLPLYDKDDGFFIPNDRKKYSVGENDGMKVDEEGGIEAHVAATKPEGVPDENWLPIERKDLGLSLVLRVYVPDIGAMQSWKTPSAVPVENWQGATIPAQKGRDVCSEKGPGYKPGAFICGVSAAFSCPAPASAGAPRYPPPPASGSRP